MIKFPRKGKKVLILTHHNADIDAICASLALYFGFGQKGIKAEIGIPKSVSRQAKNILDKFNKEVIINPDPTKYDCIFLLDASIPEQIYPVKLDSSMDISIIDHHENKKIKGRQEFVSPRRKATCELMIKVLRDNKVLITKDIANLLLAGIISDTNHFKLADITTFKLVIQLIKYGASLSYAFSLTYNPPDFNERIAKLKGAKVSKLYLIGDILVSFSYVDSHEAAVARGLLGLGADIANVICKRENELRISARANPRLVQELNLNLAKDIFEYIGEFIGGSGGGHDAAGSANSNKPELAEKAEEEILKKLEEKLGKKAKKIF